MNIGDKLGDFLLVAIDAAGVKNRRCIVYTFAHSTGLQYEYHGRIPSEAELMEAHRDWEPQHALRARLAEYAELERMFLLTQ